MALTPAQIRSLKKKAGNNSLEVEHLLKLAKFGSASDAKVLRELKEENNWSMTGLESGKRVVPFGKWAEVICCYWELGFEGLVELARSSKQTAEFCISFLEEVKTSESVFALLAIGAGVIENPETDRELALQLADAFNSVLSFKDAPAIDEETSAKVRKFLHRLLQLKLSEAERATSVCALRGVGNEESLQLMGALPSFRGSWVGLEAIVSRQIKARLRRS